MPNRFRATWFFSDGDFGWSETLWESPPTTSYNNVALNAFNLGNLRLGMCGSTTEYLGFRVSDDLVRRDSYFQETAIFGNGLGAKLAPALPSDRAYTTILLRQEATPLARRLAFLSGIPQGVINNPFNLMTLNAQWLKAFTSWANAISKPNPGLFPLWGFYGFDTTAANPATPIINLVPAAGTVTFLANPFVLNQAVFLDQTTPRRPFVGKYQVTGVAGNTITLGRYPSKKYPGPPVVPPIGWAGTTYVGGGQVRPYVDAVLPITRSFIVGETHRNRGRPFGALVEDGSRTRRQDSTF